MASAAVSSRALFLLIPLPLQGKGLGLQQPQPLNGSCHQARLCAMRERMAVETSRDEFSEENIPPPTGTIFLLGMYMFALIVGWGVMFWMLVDR